ncbi:MAG: HAMP domain-containing protein [Bacteroidetes bacterium]|nr:HAMP domain-containing protein [Bacteroidota bacterium]
MTKNTAGDQGGLRFTIFYQILITMLVLSLIPLGGLWYIGIYKSKQDWSTSVFQRLSRDSEALAHRVDDWTSMNLRVLGQNADIPSIKGMDAQSQNPVLKSITDTYNWIYLAFTIQPDGKNVGRSDGKPVKFYGDRNYFQQVMDGNDIGQQVLLGKTSGKPAFVLSKSIRSSRTKIVGVIAIAMSLEDLSDTITKTRIGNTGFAILLDGNNRLIAHGRGEIDNELQDMSNHPALNASTQIDKNAFSFEDNGKKIVAYRYQTKLGWQMIVQQDYEEAFSAARKAEMNAVILLIVTLFIVLAVAYFLAQRLSKPIQNLTEIADEISLGKLGAVIDETERGDEIGALARAVERMGVSLQIAFDRLRK